MKDEGFHGWDFIMGIVVESGSLLPNIQKQSF